MEIVLTVIIVTSFISIIVWISERRTKKIEAEMDADDFVVRSGLGDTVIVQGNQITSKTFFGKERTYAFDYITSVNRRCTYWTRDVDTIEAYHDNERLFRVTSFYQCFNLLAARLESEGFIYKDL